MCRMVFLNSETVFRQMATLDMSCRELSRKAKVSPSTITNWIQDGRIKAKYSTVLKVANALGCLPEFLVLEEDVPESGCSWSIELTKSKFDEGVELEQMSGRIRIDAGSNVHFAVSNWTFTARTLKRVTGFRFVEGSPFQKGRILVGLHVGPDLILGTGLLLHGRDSFHLRISGTRL